MVGQPPWPTDARGIPDMDIGAILGLDQAQQDVQYGSLGDLAALLGRSPVPHRHDGHAQIHFVASGGFELYLDGQVERGSGPAVFLTPPATPHRFTLSDRALGHVLTVSRALLWRFAECDPSLPAVDEIVPFCCFLRDEDGLALAVILAECFATLRQETINQDVGRKSTREALSQMVLALTFRARGAGEGRAGTGPKAIALYRRFLLLVDQHLISHWSIRRFAEELHVTEGKLLAVCRACAGRPAKAILQDRLMQEARRLLAFSNASIKEVSAMLGFEGAPYFCRLFKRANGVTPQNYREMVRGAGVTGR